MTDDRMGGIVLIAGTAGSIATMILHPSGHNLFAPGQVEPMVRLGVIAHTLGIASMPISFLGAFALSRRLASPDRLALAALVMYGFALAAGVIAPVVDGLVVPGLARRRVWQSRYPEDPPFHCAQRLRTALIQIVPRKPILYTRLLRS